MKKRNSSGTDKILSRWSGFGLIFLAGILFGIAGLQPSKLIADGLTSTSAVLREAVRDRYDILQPIVHAGAGVTVHDRTRAQAGLTLVQGLLPGGAQVRLYDMDGAELHRWNVDFFGIWDSYDHIVPPQNVPSSRWNYHTQGFHAYPDGRLLVNVGDKGLAMLNRCGEVVWRVDSMTHHSVTVLDDGTILVPSHRPVTQTDADLLPYGVTRAELTQDIAGGLHNYENLVLEIAPDGTIVKEFSVLQAVYDAGLERALFDARQNRLSDPLHLNDIEIVTPELAARIGDVSAGDYLVSLRNIHAIAVLDRDSGELLWWKTGPWVRQHDPDVTPDGRITIFNNRSPYSAKSVRNSQVVRFDPASGETEILHPVGEEDRFSTGIMGTQQSLANGNMLIAESMAGRVLEVSREGKLLWELMLPYDEEVASLVEEAQRVPDGYFGDTNWNCSPNEE